ncbi:MAG: hypothetical protein HYV65_00050 [Candidatus Spechtbacteria bacterium]|nr:hypothetical protein [Candidatus Spechtbacteria bacterium]
MVNQFQLIGRLVALLREADPEKFDDAVAQAKRNDLEKLFDAQIATLKDRGVPEQIVEILQNQKGAVVKKASEVAIGDGNIPFLPVIPRSYRSPYDLMAMVKNGGKVGYTYLNPTAISDVVDAPSEPYYIYDVEDGNSTRGKSPENAEKILKQQKRSPLTAAEVMALTTHTDVLSRHYVWATGSRYESADGVPNVYLDGGDRPRLFWYGVGDSDGRWGSASCGSR